MVLEITMIYTLSYIFGTLFSKLKLPKLLAYLLLGIGFQYIPWFQGDFLAYKKTITTVALSIILLKAGLGIDKITLKIIGKKAIKLGTIPNLLEAITVGLLGYFLLDFTIIEAGLLGFIISPVSPAVVIPSMMKLKEKGYNRSGIPVLNLASASIDDVLSVLLFSLFLFLYLGRVEGTHVITILMPILYILIMLTGYLLHNRPLPKLRKTVKMSWSVAQVLLFFLIGSIVNIETMVHLGFISAGIVIVGLVMRVLTVHFILKNSFFNNRERLFCMIANTPKATVQASLGALPLLYGVPGGEIILAMSTFSILMTAPLGLILIEKTGYTFLT